MHSSYRRQTFTLDSAAVKSRHNKYIHRKKSMVHGPVEQCLNRDRGVVGSSLIGDTALFFSKTLYLLLSTGSNQENRPGMTENVDSDVKNQNKQSNKSTPKLSQATISSH